MHDAGRYREALESLFQARSENPDHIDTIILIAWCYYQLRDYYKGMNVGHDAIHTDPENHRCYAVYGVCCTHVGNFTWAKSSLDRAVELNPAYAHGHYLRAFYFGRRNQWKNALKSVELAVQLAPENATYHSLRGEVLMMLGRVAEAKAASFVALSLTPESGRTHLMHGEVLLAEGNVTGAITALREALRSNPNDKLAKEWLTEAAHGRWFAYRWYIRVRFFTQRWGVQPQLLGLVLVILTLFVAVGLEGADLISKTTGGAIMFAAILSFLLTEVWKPLLDARLALDSNLKHLLTRRERLEALLVTSVIFGCLVALVTVCFLALFANLNGDLAAFLSIGSGVAILLSAKTYALTRG